MRERIPTPGGSHGGLQVMNSRACSARIAELTAFENRHFGKAFAWTVEQNAAWSDSLTAVNAAICQSGDAAIVASMSVMVVDADSCKRFVAGKIKESELQPWTHHPDASRPIVYFASVISPQKSCLPVLYATLAEDTCDLLRRQGLQPQEGFAIAASAAGLQHLQRNGFQPLGDHKYLGEHVFMSITARRARTLFWRNVLFPAVESATLRVQQAAA